MGESIFYSNASDDEKLYKIKSDGTGRLKLCDDRINFLNTDGNWLYYAVYVKDSSKDKGQINKVETDGTGRTKLSDDTPSCMNIEDGWIYYNLGNSLCKMRVDGTEKTVLVNEYACFLNKKDDWIYYCKGGIAGDAAHGSIYKIKLDGTRKSKVLDDEYARNFSIVGDWIYYTRFKTSGGSIVEPVRLYKVRINGSERQLIQ